VKSSEFLHKERRTMTHYESPMNELAERRHGTDASLATSIADILGTARSRSESSAGSASPSRPTRTCSRRPAAPPSSRRT
jgi:hypothetical protein